MRLLMTAMIVSLTCSSTARAELLGAADQIVVDGVTLRFGDTIEVTGVCLADRSFGREYAAATIQPLRIGGRPTQERLEFHVGANEREKAPTYKDLQQLKPGTHYRVRGKLMNARINGRYNVCSLLAEQVEKIATTKLRVTDFLDREATFEGLAAIGGQMKYGDETVSLEGVNAWPQEIDGKHVAVRGIVRKDDRGLKVEKPTWKLYLLDELVNQPVVLEGFIASLNDHWWFAYRNERLYLTSAAGPVLRFGGGNHYRAVRVSGLLVKQDRPALDQISLKDARDLVPTYVIRGAKVEPTGAALTWQENFGTVYPSHHKSKGGVPELLAESSFRRNLWGNETNAQLLMERNFEAISAFLQKEVSAEHRNELARRMTAEDTDKVLQLLYAAMLANANDDRGRTRLLEATSVRDDTLDLNTLYCLGVFPHLAEGTDRKVDVAWAAKPCIALLQNRNVVAVRGLVLQEEKDKTRMSVASAVVYGSAIPSLLRQIGTPDCRQALMDVVASKADGSGQVARELCQWTPPLSPAELLAIDKLVKEESGIHRTILRLLLSQKSPDAVERYVGDLKESFVYMDFRDQLSPVIVNALKPRVNQLAGDAKVHARLLIALGEQDPAAELLRFLRDPEWADKNIVLYELARLGEPHAVADIARFLHDVPKVAVKDDGLGPANMVSHALEAIAHTGSAEAIRELIELLPVDLSRFGGYLKREEWPLVIAEHLIELTGESFGTDFEKWRAWRRAHPEHHVPRDMANPGGGFRTDAGNVIDLGQ